MVIVIINLIPKKDCFALEQIPIFSIFGEEKNLRKILQVPRLAVFASEQHHFNQNVDEYTTTMYTRIWNKRSKHISQLSNLLDFMQEFYSSNIFLHAAFFHSSLSSNSWLSAHNCLRSFVLLLGPLAIEKDCPSEVISLNCSQWPDPRFEL